MPRLKSAVHVQHPTTREWIVLQPGDEPAPELTAEITNPDAWADGEAPSSDKPTVASEGKEPFGFTAPDGDVPAEYEEAPEASEAPRRRRRPADAEGVDA